MNQISTYLTRTICTISLILLFGCANQIQHSKTYNVESHVIKNKIDTIVSKINGEQIFKNDSIQIYKQKHKSAFLYSFKTINRNDSISVYISTLGGLKKANEKLNIGLFSFLDQELGLINLKSDSDFYYKPPLKYNDQMWKKNLINIGYSNYYSNMDNPFIDKKDGKTKSIVFGTIEVLQYCLFFAGPIIGSSLEDKIAISLTGLGGVIAWKIIVPFNDNKYAIKRHNDFVRSGYSFPIELKNK